MKEALLYQKLPGKKVRCQVCQRRCLIPPNGTGFCKTRVNKDGKLYTTIYGLVSCANNDPIEKKPVFHYQPGSLCFSLGTFGCNFRCKFCQNYDISYTDATNISMINQGSVLTPEEAVRTAFSTGAKGMAWTYNEPAIWLEYFLDCCKLIKNWKLPAPHRLVLGKIKNWDLYTCWVTNGYATKETINLIAAYLDVYRVDLKSFSDDFYQKLIGIPKALGVFETTKYLNDQYPNIHIECVTNIIPTWNDSKENLTKIAKWIAENLGPLTPWHVTAYHPALINDLLPNYSTPLETLERAQKIGQKAGLAFVYLGNVETKTGENTYCPKCQSLNIERRSYQTRVLAVKKEKNRGYCLKCGQNLNLVIF